MVNIATKHVAVGFSNWAIKMLRKSIVNTGWQIGGKAVTVLISLITTGILTRKLGSGAYGSFVLVTSIFIFLDSLADFGTKIIGVRNLSKEGGLGKSGTFWQIFWLRLMMTGVAWGLGMGLILGWEGLAAIRKEAMVALAMIWMTSVAGSWEIRWQTEMKMEKKVVAEILFPLLFLAGMWWWRGELNLMGVFGGYLVARILSLGVGIKIGGNVERIQKLNWKEIKKLLGEAWPMGVYLLVFAAYDRAVDSMMIERMMGIEEVGWYGLAYKIYSNLVQPAYFLVVSVFPLLSKKKETRTVFWETMGLLVIGAVGVIMVVNWGAPWMIEILGGKSFGESVGVLRILMVGLFFAYIQHLIGFTLISKGGQKKLLGVGLMVLVFNVVANWWAIPRWGILGAAGVTGTTEAVATVLMGWMLVKSK